MMKLKEMREMVDKYGLVVISVANQYVYTVGMAKAGLPDLIISTIDPKMAHWLLTEAYQWGIKFGLDEGENKNLIMNKKGDSLAVIFTPLDLSCETINKMVAQSGFFYHDYPDYVKDNERSLMQIFWPDDKGLFPTEKGYNQQGFTQEIIKASGA